MKLIKLNFIIMQICDTHINSDAPIVVHCCINIILLYYVMNKSAWMTNIPSCSHSKGVTLQYAFFVFMFSFITLVFVSASTHPWIKRLGYALALMKTWICFNEFELYIMQIQKTYHHFKIWRIVKRSSLCIETITHCITQIICICYKNGGGETAHTSMNSSNAYERTIQAKLDGRSRQAKNAES